MGFDDLKEFHGETYSGMPVGGQHRWNYPNGRWVETKVTPDRWEVAFSAPKRRVEPAPIGSGAPPGTQYHWFLLAHQWVRKVDEDTYATFLQADKFKLAHKRPPWKQWSSEYPGQEPARDHLVRILEAALVKLKSGPEAVPPFDPSRWNESIPGLVRPPRSQRRGRGGNRLVQARLLSSETVWSPSSFL